jgi:hypothetical protein
MVSFEESKKNLNTGAKIYTGDEIKAISKFLYQFAEIAFSEFKKIEYEKERNSLHPC